METPSPVDDLVGRVLGGRYRIERHLRRGGMGAVYVARDTTAGKDVAIKVVRQALLEDAQAIARFKREARLSTELKHDNIVCTLDVGDDAGLLWIAMELLEGESLRDRLDARGRMPWQETLPLIEQIARALGAAHERVVIHRDLKPENVMLVESDGTVKAKLLDFGVAKQAQIDGETSGTSNMTGTGLIVGTPGYVAPEVVLEGNTDDPRSDFYALGVVWFEMLTGQKPFTAKTAFALAMRHAHEPAPTPTSLVPYSPVPGPIERLVLRLLAKSPDERPRHAAELLTSLATLADESQRSLTGTPTPGTFEPTLTDNMSANGTNVMPFTGTPRPSQPTPSTAMRPQMTPAPELLRQIPKKWFAIAGVVLVAIVTVVVVAVNIVTRQLNDTLASAPAGEYASSSVRATTSSGAPPLPPSATSVPPIPSPVVAAAVPPVVPIAAAAPVAPVDATVDEPKRRPVRGKLDKIRERLDERRDARRDEQAGGVGKLKLVLRPKNVGWLVSIDGAIPREDRQFELRAGKHTLSITAPERKGPPIVRVVDVPAGGEVIFNEKLE